MDKRERPILKGKDAEKFLKTKEKNEKKIKEKAKKEKEKWDKQKSESTIKALTIQQPWASLIALGEKKFETRSWATKYRGKIAIHAGKKIDKQAYKEFEDILKKHGITNKKALPIGCVLAIGEITKCHKVIEEDVNYAILDNREKVEGLEYLMGFYEEGRSIWQIDNVEKLENPIEAKGQLSLWNWNNSIEKK